MPYDYEIVGVKNNREAKKYKFFVHRRSALTAKILTLKQRRQVSFTQKDVGLPYGKGRWLSILLKKCYLVPS